MYIKKQKISYPITLETDSSIIKSHLNYDPSENIDNEYINHLIKSSIEHCEGFNNKDIAYTLNTFTIWNFYDDEIQIGESNFHSINEIISDTSTLLSYNDIVIDNNCFKILFGYSISSNPLTIKFYTGYQSINDMPIGLKHMILIKTADLYNHRDSDSASSIVYNRTWERLSIPYRKLY